MTTVPKAGDPPPANNAQTKTVSDAMSGNYRRPASGGPPEAGNSAGTPGPTAGPATNLPGYAINWAGNPPSTGGTQVGEDVGSGATIIAGQPDATGHPASDASGGGTVGDSGNQGAGPGPTPMGATGMPDLDHDGDSL